MAHAGSFSVTSYYDTVTWQSYHEAIVLDDDDDEDEDDDEAMESNSTMTVEADLEEAEFTKAPSSATEVTGWFFTTSRG